MKTTFKITGSDAIRLAERDHLTLRCDDNPFNPGANVITPGVARQIANGDPDLVYVLVEPGRGWMDSEGRLVSVLDNYCFADYFSDQGMYLGPDDNGIEPLFWDAQTLQESSRSDLGVSGQV